MYLYLQFKYNTTGPMCTCPPPSVVRLDLATMSWLPAPPLPSPRGWPGVAVLDGQVLVQGDGQLFKQSNKVLHIYRLINKQLNIRLFLTHTLLSSCTVLEAMTRGTRLSLWSRGSVLRGTGGEGGRREGRSGAGADEAREKAGAS